MIENYFSTPIYFDSLATERSLFETAIENLLNLYQVKNQWQPDNDTAATSFVPGETNNFIKNTKLEDLVIKHIGFYLDKTDQDYTKGSINLDSSWINIFREGQLIGYHDHGYQPNVISGVYYFRAPKDCSKIIFKSSNPFAVSFPHLSSKYTNLISCEVEQDMIILFPSWLNHKVEPNKNKDLRISIAFNVSFDYSFYEGHHAS
jgi:uncharacterized protein (TIGR02466 family)